MKEHYNLCEQCKRIVDRRIAAKQGNPVATVSFCCKNNLSCSAYDIFDYTYDRLKQENELKMNWISVKKQEPPLDTYLLCTGNDNLEDVFMAYKNLRGWWRYFESGCGCCSELPNEITHWMPLPEKPNEMD